MKNAVMQPETDALRNDVLDFRGFYNGWDYCKITTASAEDCYTPTVL